MPTYSIFNSLPNEPPPPTKTFTCDKEHEVIIFTGCYAEDCPLCMYIVDNKTMHNQYAKVYEELKTAKQILSGVQGELERANKELEKYEN